MNSFVALFDDLLSIPSHGNGSCNHSDKNSNAYERSCIGTLEKHGFTAFQNLSGKKSIEALFALEHPEWDNLPWGRKKARKLALEDFKIRLKDGKLKLRHFYSKSYIYQPFGSQDHPDFFILHGRVIQALEAKSGKNKFLFNSGRPKNPNQIYLFALNSGSGAALAKHFFSSPTLSSMNDLEETFVEPVAATNQILKELKTTGHNRYGLYYYVRRMVLYSEQMVGKNNEEDLQEVRDYLSGL